MAEEPTNLETLTSSLGAVGITNEQLAALAVAAAGLLFSWAANAYSWYQNREQTKQIEDQEKRIQRQKEDWEKFRVDMELRGRRMNRFESLQDLMDQYKKPLLASAFDLQSRLAQQVNSNFLHSFHTGEASKGRDGPFSKTRDALYAKFNFVYVIAEFLGWLEVIRREVVFISGNDDKAKHLNELFDAIKFQFTGDTPFQGCDVDQTFGHNLQLYNGELRAIGEVMLCQRPSDEQDTTNLMPIGYAEFYRRMTCKQKQDLIGKQGLGEWEGESDTKEAYMQQILTPLMHHVDELGSLPAEEAPKQRMAILQVLLCKLIDMLDEGVPWNVGPRYDKEAREEAQYIPRNFRLIPLVNKLTPTQRTWLAEQAFFRDDRTHDPFFSYDPAWFEEMEEYYRTTPGAEEAYKYLTFRGFGTDLLGTAMDVFLCPCCGREKADAARTRRSKLKEKFWPGAFPAQYMRVRSADWFERDCKDENLKMPEVVALYTSIPYPIDDQDMLCYCACTYGSEKAMPLLTVVGKPVARKGKWGCWPFWGKASNKVTPEGAAEKPKEQLWAAKAAAKGIPGAPVYAKLEKLKPAMPAKPSSTAAPAGTVTPPKPMPKAAAASVPPGRKELQHDNALFVLTAGAPGAVPPMAGDVEQGV